MTDGHDTPEAPGESTTWLVGLAKDNGRVTLIAAPLVLVQAYGAADAADTARPQLGAGEGDILVAVEVAEFIVDPATVSELG